MSVEIQPLDELAMWNRPAPGHVAPWVQWTVAAACGMTIAVIAATANVVWRMDGRGLGLDPLTFQVCPTVLVALAIAAGFAPRASTSRFIRLAIVLPVIHIVAMIAIWWLDTRLDLIALGERTPLVRALPVLDVTLAIAAATAIAAGLIARKRREWIHTAVTIALANLLMLGIWIPIAARWLVGLGRNASWNAATELMESPERLVAFVLVPPFAVACGYAIVTQHAPRFARRLATPIAICLGVSLIAAIVLRLEGTLGSYLLYDNLVHVLLCTAVVAIVVTAGLGMSTWFAGRAGLSRLSDQADRRTGVVDHDGDDDVVACLEITSWLRGPRVISRPFGATTERGIALPVPGDAEVAASLPLVSSVLRTGEAVVVMRTGDRVELAGYVDRTLGEGPFRGGSIAVPGPRGVIVGRTGGESTSAAFQEIGLAAWRPAVAYLVIVIVVAIPGLLGVLSPTWK